MEEPVYNGDYKKTKTYTGLSPKDRKKWDTYRIEQGMDDHELYLVLYREDMRNITKEERNKANLPSETMVIGAMAFFLWAVTSNTDKRLMLTSCICVFVATFFYFNGTFNPYTRTIKVINKQLKKNYPHFQSYKEWNGEGKQPE